VSHRIEQALASWRSAATEWEAGVHDRDVAVRLASAWLEYQLASGAVPDDQIVLVADDDARYLAATPNVERYLGVDPETVLGMTVSDLTPPDDRPSVMAAWAAFIRAGEASGEFRLWRPDAQDVPAAFEAKADAPVAGLHVSRLTPAAQWVARGDLVAAGAAARGTIAISETRALAGRA